MPRQNTRTQKRGLLLPRAAARQAAGGSMRDGAKANAQRRKPFWTGGRKWCAADHGKWWSQNS